MSNALCRALLAVTVVAVVVHGAIVWRLLLTRRFHKSKGSWLPIFLMWGDEDNYSPAGRRLLAWAWGLALLGGAVGLAFVVCLVRSK